MGIAAGGAIGAGNMDRIVAGLAEAAEKGENLRIQEVPVAEAAKKKGQILPILEVDPAIGGRLFGQSFGKSAELHHAQAGMGPEKPLRLRRVVYQHRIMIRQEGKVHRHGCRVLHRKRGDKAGRREIDGLAQPPGAFE